MKTLVLSSLTIVVSIITCLSAEHGEKASFEGLVRKNPTDKDEIVLAALSCNSNRDRGLREEYTPDIKHQNPDLVFFAGDQSYDHKEHTAAWLKFGLAFREIFRHRPCVTIPDDHDSNGWPQTARNRAIELIQKAKAVHIAGDQHIATVIRHGIRDYGDGPWAFVVPAIVNTYYGRWWWPEDEKPGANPVPGSPLPWTGDYLDGFNNKVTMHACANPHPKREGIQAWKIKDNPGLKPLEGWADGWGLIRFQKKSGEVTFECWPRFADVTKPNAKQFPGWLITVKP